MGLAIGEARSHIESASVEEDAEAVGGEDGGVAFGDAVSWGWPDPVSGTDQI